jgi:ABC-type Fe3+-hydroxamate transport system substrate-binding protein
MKFGEPEVECYVHYNNKIIFFRWQKGGSGGTLMKMVKKNKIQKHNELTWHTVNVEFLRENNDEIVFIFLSFLTHLTQIHFNLSAQNHQTFH